MEELQVIEHQNKRILTTEQLAEVYGTDTKNIQMNFSNHKDNFIEGKHYYFLEGTELKAFKSQVNDIGVVSKFASHMYLWTERGANRHCKILDTDKAWEQFDKLEETYFNVKDKNAKLDNLSPQLQVLINLELEQEKIRQELKVTNDRLDNIKELVALNPTQWRKDTADLINKMALNAGGYEHIRAIRNESYKLLDERFAVSLNRRLSNKRKTLSLNGVCKSKIDKVNQLDVIADDKKLIEGYIAIIKEMAIKYGAVA